MDLSESVEVLRMQVFSVTGVQPENQKIIGIMGGVLQVRTRACMRVYAVSAGERMFVSMWFALNRCTGFLERLKVLRLHNFMHVLTHHVNVAYI